MKNNILHIDIENISDPTIKAIANTLNKVVSAVYDGRVKQAQNNIENNKKETDGEIVDIQSDIDYIAIMTEVDLDE